MAENGPFIAKSLRAGSFQRARAPGNRFLRSGEKKKYGTPDYRPAVKLEERIKVEQKKIGRGREKRFRLKSENVRRERLAHAAMRHYQRRPRSGLRSGALDQSNGNRGWYRGCVYWIARAHTCGYTCVGGGGDSESRDSSADRETQSKNSRAAAFPANIRAAEQRWFRGGDNFQSARGNGADAIIFRGVGRGEGRRHVSAGAPRFAPSLASLSPLPSTRHFAAPFVTVRSRSPLSGVSDGYEILRAPAAEWGPPEVNYSPPPAARASRRRFPGSFVAAIL